MQDAKIGAAPSLGAEPQASPQIESAPPSPTLHHTLATGDSEIVDTALADLAVEPDHFLLGATPPQGQSTSQVTEAREAQLQSTASRAEAPGMAERLSNWFRRQAAELTVRTVTTAVEVAGELDSASQSAMSATSRMLALGKALIPQPLRDACSKLDSYLCSLDNPFGEFYRGCREHIVRFSRSLGKLINTLFDPPSPEEDQAKSKDDDSRNELEKRERDLKLFGLGEEIALHVDPKLADPLKKYLEALNESLRSETKRDPMAFANEARERLEEHLSRFEEALQRERKSDREDRETDEAAEEFLKEIKLVREVADRLALELQLAPEQLEELHQIIDESSVYGESDPVDLRSQAELLRSKQA
ncbi:MAG: hypothetical protein KDD64_03295 [Bdellovibrionales bacterium]|nr:hypothetical protein [Bdellovibrionales bacterium]